MKSFSQFNEDLQARVSQLAQSQQARLNKERERVAKYKARKQDEAERDREQEEIASKVADKLKRWMRSICDKLLSLLTLY